MELPPQMEKRCSMRVSVTQLQVNSRTQMANSHGKTIRNKMKGLLFRKERGPNRLVAKHCDRKGM
jgi:hypothetical protein